MCGSNPQNPESGVWVHVRVPQLRGTLQTGTCTIQHELANIPVRHVLTPLGHCGRAVCIQPAVLQQVVICYGWVNGLVDGFPMNEL